MAPEQCATPDRECPWGPKEFQEQGRVFAIVQATATEVVDMRVEHKQVARDVSDIRMMLAQLPISGGGSSKKNVAVSASAAGIISGVIIAVWEYIKRTSVS